jgi:hypothetical protein
MFPAQVVSQEVVIPVVSASFQLFYTEVLVDAPLALFQILLQTYVKFAILPAIVARVMEEVRACRVLARPHCTGSAAFVRKEPTLILPIDAKCVM